MRVGPDRHLIRVSEVVAGRVDDFLDEALLDAADHFGGRPRHLGERGDHQIGDRRRPAELGEMYAPREVGAYQQRPRGAPSFGSVVNR